MKRQYFYNDSVDAHELDAVTTADKLWYQTLWSEIIEPFFVSPPQAPDAHFLAKRAALIKYFVQVKAQGRLLLSKRRSLFNDDDRFKKGRYVETIDTAVIHHTGLSEGITADELDIWGLMRVYANLHIVAPNFQVGDKKIAPSSGHYLNGVQRFTLYHYLVTERRVIQLLDKRHTALGAGNYPINCRAIQIVIDGNLNDRVPTLWQIMAIRRIIKQHRLKNVVTHKEVKKPQTGTTECPGIGHERWFHQLTD